MIDLETLSTNPEAVILTFGGVKFDAHSSMSPYDELYFRVDVDSQTAMNRHVMQDTLDWWSQQPKEISEEALSDQDRIGLDDMVKAVNKWCVGVDVFWCQGPLFDYAILQNIYTQLGHPQPWNYWQIRDSRTLFSLVPRDNNKRVGHHNALQDCIYQAKKVQEVYKQLNVKIK
ncbi:MAG: 3'-5' exonuclease [Candidatus Poseidoniales archaeon]